MSEYPTCCPFCGGHDITEIVEWEAHSLEEHGNAAVLTEWQCFDCDNRSFWV
jgi:hypothetical protein